MVGRAMACLEDVELITPTGKGLPVVKLVVWQGGTGGAACKGSRQVAEVNKSKKGGRLNALPAGWGCGEDINNKLPLYHCILEPNKYILINRNATI